LNYSAWTLAASADARQQKSPGKPLRQADNGCGKYTMLPRRAWRSGQCGSPHRQHFRNGVFTERRAIDRMAGWR